MFGIPRFYLWFDFLSRISGFFVAQTPFSFYGLSLDIFLQHCKFRNKNESLLGSKISVSSWGLLIFSLSRFSGLFLKMILLLEFYLESKFPALIMSTDYFLGCSFLLLSGVEYNVVDFQHSKYCSILFKSEWCFSNSVNFRPFFKFIFCCQFYKT